MLLTPTRMTASLTLRRFFSTRLCFGFFGALLGYVYHFVFIIISMLSLNFRKIIDPIASIIITIAQQVAKFFKTLLSPFSVLAEVLDVVYKSIIHGLKCDKLLFFFNSIYGFVVSLNTHCFALLILAVNIHADTADYDNATDGVKVLSFRKFHLLQVLGCKDNNFSTYNTDFQYAI